MGAASDDTLLASFALGDPDAAAFIRRFQGRVYGLARSMVADPHLADDVAQEAFVRAWRSAASYDPRRRASNARPCCSPRCADGRPRR